MPFGPYLTRLRTYSRMAEELRRWFKTLVPPYLVYWGMAAGRTALVRSLRSSCVVLAVMFRSGEGLPELQKLIKTFRQI